MTRQHTYHIALARLLLCMTLMLPGIEALAQPGNAVYKTSLLYDTLLANTNKEFLFNSVTITNQTTEKISLTINVVAPKGWNSTQKVINLSLNGNENTIIPIRLSASGTQTSDWQTVKLEYRVNNGIETYMDTFRVRLKEFSKFKGTLLNSNIVLPSYQKNISFPVFVKNLGNTPDIYSITYSNDILQLQEKITFPLAAAHDTTYIINIKMTEGQYSLLRKQEIKVLVSNQAGETVNLSQNLSRIGYMLRENSTAYLDMPLFLEAGGMYSGEGSIQYYGGLRGYLDLSPDDRVSIDFRSNTYAPGEVIDNQIIRADYQGKHLYAQAGNLMEVTDFFMDGYGGKIGYKWDDRTKAQVFSMLKSRIGDSKLYGANVSYGIRPNITGFNTVTANFDNIKRQNGYLARQSVDVRFGDNGKFIATGGVGMDESTGYLKGSDSSRLLGTQYGYDLQWSNKWIGILSNVSNYSNSFPGIYKGQRVQIHDVRAFYKTAFIGGYYEYTFRKQNYFLDDSLYSNVFNLKTNNYGVRAGVNLKKANFIASVGQQDQEQPSDQALNPKYVFSYVNLNISTSVIDGLFFNTNSYIGRGKLSGQGGNGVFVNSNQATLQYKFTGLSLRYDIGPYYYHEYLAYLRNQEKYQRIIVSPYADLSFFQRALSIRAQYNYAKTTPNTSEVSNVLGSIQYTNSMRGYDFNLSGIIPLSQKSAAPFLNASMRVRLHAPFVAIRKYYNVKLVLFKDLNGNGRQDSGEEPITDQMLSINNNLFVTNEYGNAIFKNVSKGDFRIDLGYSGKVKGWIPVGGTMQEYGITGNKTLYIPYKISKVLQGKLSLSLDSNSNLSFSLANIRVTATTGLDSATTYSTITDENGEFYFNLPDGNYTVMLSEAAFDENFRPVQFAQRADLVNNNTKTVYFEIKQKKRAINIKKK